MGAECSCKITPSKGICTWLAMGFPGTTTLPDNKSRFLANFAKGSHVKQKLNLGQNGCLGDLFVGFSRNLFQVRTRTGFCYRSNGSYDLPVRLPNNFKPRPDLSLTIRLLSDVKCV